MSVQDDDCGLQQEPNLVVDFLVDEEVSSAANVPSPPNDVPVRRIVMVSGDHIMLIDDGTLGDHSNVFDESSVRPTESFIDTFDSHECLTESVGNTGGFTSDHPDEDADDGLCMIDGIDGPNYEDDKRHVDSDVGADCYENQQGGDDAEPIVADLCSSDPSHGSSVEKDEDHEQTIITDCPDIDGQNCLVDEEDNLNSISTAKILEPISSSLLMHANNIYQMVPNPDGTLSLIAIDQSQIGQLIRSQQDGGTVSGDVPKGSGVHIMQVRAINVTSTPVALMPAVTEQTSERVLPQGCPQWASSLNDCERIGDSFRGWVETESELDAVIANYKQLTRSFWGTRQSPSSTKQSTRLMWKSQYVPFDGIPFVNSGSRAVVYECQFGPRRKNNAKNSGPTDASEPAAKTFKQTCPARIYVKKVRKFLEFAVNLNGDKKQLKADMDNAFQLLKDCYTEKPGHERYYVQLPTSDAHEFHADTSNTTTAAVTASSPVDRNPESSIAVPRRLHPLVAQRIRDLVSGGELQLYAIRHQLRRFVEKELFEGSEFLPEKHDLTYYPTIHDLQNHIHQALKDIQDGTLSFSPRLEPQESLKVEASHGSPEVDDDVIGPSIIILTDSDRPDLEPTASDQLELEPTVSEELHLEPEMAADGNNTESESCLLGIPMAACDSSHSTAPDDDSEVEQVTLMLTSNPVEGGHHTVTQVKLRMLNGVTRVSNVVPRHVAQMISSLTPDRFSHNAHSITFSLPRHGTVQQSSLSSHDAAEVKFSIVEEDFNDMSDVRASTPTEEMDSDDCQSTVAVGTRDNAELAFDDAVVCTGTRARSRTGRLKRVMKNDENDDVRHLTAKRTKR